MGQEVCGTANDIMNCVNLVHNYKCGIIVIVRHGIYNLLEKRIAHFIMATLLQFEVLNSTQELE